jgi:hypothetical protein
MKIMFKVKFYVIKMNEESKKIVELSCELNTFGRTLIYEEIGVRTLIISLIHFKMEFVATRLLDKTNLLN